MSNDFKPRKAAKKQKDVIVRFNISSGHRCHREVDVIQDGGKQYGFKKII